ncbi:hypothetical protein FGIG_07961 [Fasciola gigantica]|uniref:CUB domain-containing protein n=1 Tax=Fasciola gigantica TaxID=46835 RepID=A0A504YNQ0_FASGI|nr:hypothetical protein FGIG_07961 [Fasciola gigantica]
MDCLIYSFLAQSDELVHIQFVEFNIPRVTPNLSSPSCSAHVRVYGQIQTTLLNDDDPYDEELCGSLIDLPQDQYFSASQRLILSVKLNPELEVMESGFLGHFWFEPKDKYTSSGMVIPGTECDRFAVSESSRFTNPNNTGRFGRMHSPNYPRNYQPGLYCQFYFVGQPRERVVLTLHDVELAKTNENCTKRPRGDYILIQEAKNTVQSPSDLIAPRTPIAPVQPGKYVWHYCGKLAQAQIVSDGPNLVLTFVSNHDNHQRRGFALSYQFVHRNQVRPTTFQTSEIFMHMPVEEYQIMDSTFGESTDWHTPGLVDQFSWYDGRHKGTILSPNYPDVYPQEVDQSYVLLGPPQGQIHISFLEFRLDFQHPSNCIQYKGDRVELYIGPESDEHVWGVLCGVTLPEHLRDLVIQSNRLRLRFVSDNVTSKTELGFRIIYDFQTPRLSTSQFSPTTRNQSQIRLEKEYYSEPVGDTPGNLTFDNCTITIDSNGMVSKGYIRLLDSVSDHPIEGQLPTDETPRVERCRWILRGETHERIKLKVVSLKGQTTKLPTSSADGSSLQNDEFQSHGENMYEKRRQNSRLNYPIPRLKCMKPYQVEILTFQKSSQTKNYMDLLEPPTRPFDHTSVGSFVDSERTRTGPEQDPTDGRLMQISDRLELCLGSRIENNQFIQGYMSTSVPRVELILKTPVLNKSEAEQSISTRRSTTASPELAIEYSFVTDYGVLSRFGHQNAPGCDFIFRSSESAHGNFTSPNYPGLYPADLTCHYMFIGDVDEVIELNFQKFDVDSNTATCSDGSGDYIELEPCTQYNFLKLTRKRYCQMPPKNQFIVIHWNNPCLNLQFVSDRQTVRTGFLGIYRFHKSGTSSGSRHLSWLLWLIVLHRCTNPDLT